MTFIGYSEISILNQQTKYFDKSTGTAEINEKKLEKVVYNQF